MTLQTAHTLRLLETSAVVAPGRHRERAPHPVNETEQDRQHHHHHRDAEGCHGGGGKPLAEASDALAQWNQKFNPFQLRVTARNSTSEDCESQIPMS